MHMYVHQHTHTRAHSTLILTLVYVFLLQVPVVASLPVATVMSWHDEMGLLLVAVSGDQNIHIWNVKD